MTRGVTVLDHAPDPVTFYNDYVKPKRPLLFRGAQHGAPAMTRWASDDYLQRTYGDTAILFEAKTENRSGDPRRTTLGTFLKHYKTKNMCATTHWRNVPSFFLNMCATTHWRNVPSFSCDPSPVMF